MKVALDPYMLRTVPLTELPGLVHELGYEHIELSPREDFIPFFVHPRADKATIASFKKALASAGVSVSSVLPLYRWSGPDEDERQAAVRYWKRAIQVAVDLDCRIMNSEFNGRPEAAATSEAQFWRSLEELLPVFEREGVQLRLEPHPDDFVENGHEALSLIRGIDNDLVSFLYCAPHTFHQGGDMAEIMRDAGPLLTQLHIADSFDHRGSSGSATSSTHPGTPARIHQHLDIGQGEVDWDLFFATLAEVGFDGIATVCVFAWEERPRTPAATTSTGSGVRRQARRPVGRCADDQHPVAAPAGQLPRLLGRVVRRRPGPDALAPVPGRAGRGRLPLARAGPYGYLPTDPGRLRERSTGAGSGSPARRCSAPSTTPAGGTRTWPTPTRWPSWSRPWAPATWSCSRPTPARGRTSWSPSAGGPWSIGPPSWAGSWERSTGWRPCSTPTPTATSAPSPRSSGSWPTPTRPTSTCAWTPATSPTTRATTWS
jgi:myo-inositol catabolism protein IolH